MEASALAKERVERDEEDLVRLYLTDIGQYPLLTKDDEVRLAQAIELRWEAEEELKTKKGLTPTRRRELNRAVRDGEKAQRTFVQSNLRLVVSIAKKYQASGLPLLDLIQEGNLGLMHAVEKFDWRKGFKFSTYATWWIRQAITRGIANTGRTIRLPVHAGDTLARVQKAQARLELKLGRPATLSELGAEVELPEDKLIRCVKMATPSSATSSRTGRPSRLSRWPPRRCSRSRSTGCSPPLTSVSGRSCGCVSGSIAASRGHSKRSASTSTSHVSASVRSRRGRCRSFATPRATPAPATFSPSRASPAGGAGHSPAGSNLLRTVSKHPPCW